MSINEHYLESQKRLNYLKNRVEKLDSPSSVDVLGKFRSFDRPEFQISWHRLSDRPLTT